ncbi:MAG TPA: DUF87 domain-containing protein, partial [Candidatus Nitrosotalea sp.]|nr:DUF87 domain-containing protein [Candidatus Nitrosotalea sp.]
MEKSQFTVFGFDDRARAAGIPRTDQIHTGIFGEVGSGKSTVDTLMINQNINRKEGFLVLDPHGSLAQDALRMVPESEKDRVVYISLDSVIRWSRTVKINPLEVKDGCERYVVAMNLVNALRNIYKDSWGPQLETLLRNGANALVEIEGATLRDLVKIMTDERMRAVYLNKVANRDVKHFWTVLFPQQYQKDAGRSAYNKLDKILSTPQVAAMLDTPKSTIDFGEIMGSGKWVVIDLSSGGSDDVISFVGTILINMVYVEARKRFGKSTPPRPFFMYIDEAHLFAPFVLRELLNTMRKANVKVAIASQTINTFPREFAREISALVRTIICFKVDMETASMFKTVMPVDADTLTSMTHGRFAFYSQGDPPLSGVLKVTPIVDRAKDWSSLAGYAIQKWGEQTSLEKYMVPTKAKGESPEVTPLEAHILLLLYNQNGEMSRDQIYYYASRSFAVSTRAIAAKLDDILVGKLRLIERKNFVHDDNTISTTYRLSGLAYNSLFSRAAAGRRAGSDLHLATIFMIMTLQQQSFKFCIPDLGDSARQRPDLLIFEPKKMEGTGTGGFYDPLTWSEKTIAVEVETDPTKHGSQVVKNFQKNFDLGYDVWFVVFSQRHMQYIIDLLDRNGIDPHIYKISHIPPEAVEHSSEMLERSSLHLTVKELKVYGALKEGATADLI